MDPEKAQEAARKLAAQISAKLLSAPAGYGKLPTNGMSARASPYGGSTAAGYPVFVGNLRPTVTDTDLRTNLQKFGQIVQARIIRDRMTNQPRGYGFVNFQSEFGRQKCIKMSHQVIIQGSAVTLKAGAGTAPGMPGALGKQNPCMVWIGSLPIGPVGQDVVRLQKAFRKICGHTARSFTLKESGYGFLEYANEQEAQEAAKALNGAELGGSLLRANLAFANEKFRAEMQRKVTDLNNTIQEGKLFSTSDLVLLEKSIRTLWLGRLPEGTTSKDIKEAFEKFGQIHSTTIMRDRVTGQEKNCGFVCFEDWKSAVDALKKHNNERRSHRRRDAGMNKFSWDNIAVSRANPLKRIQQPAYDQGLIDEKGNPTVLFTQALYNETIEGQEPGGPRPQPELQYFQDPTTGQIYSSAQLGMGPGGGMGGFGGYYAQPTPEQMGYAPQAQYQPQAQGYPTSQAPAQGYPAAQAPAQGYPAFPPPANVYTAT